MKRRRLQFGLGALFAGFTVMGICLGIYRYTIISQERILYHWKLRAAEEAALQNNEQSLAVYQASREAILAGDSDRLTEIGTKFRFGQPLEIGYVPAQLRMLDKLIADEQKFIRLRQQSIDYENRLKAEYEQALWRPWRQVDTATGRPTGNLPLR